MSDYFGDLLAELGKIIHLPLVPDKSNACSIAIDPLIIQMELDKSQEHLFLFAKIIELPPGKFRENILCEALKNNGMGDPRAGVFGYIALTSHLALYQMYPITMLNGETLSGLLGAFFDMGSAWHSAISHGQPGVSSSTSSKGILPSPWGTKL
jgi:hypothetical protein